MTQYIARWYSAKSEPREGFVMADNPSHAEQLVKQMDRGASAVRLETCSAYRGP